MDVVWNGDRVCVSMNTAFWWLSFGSRFWKTSTIAFGFWLLVLVFVVTEEALVMAAAAVGFVVEILLLKYWIEVGVKWNIVYW